jgi:hypothetical protein
MAQITLNSTGVASNGALVLQSNGTTAAVTVDTSQNVGIGTASPAQRLNVATASGNCYTRVDRASQSTGQVGYQWGGGTSSTDWLVYLPASSNDLTFFGNSAERMRIDSSGNLLVGTTSQLQSSRFSVLGSGNIGDFRTSSASGYPVVCENTATGSTNMVVFLSGPSTTAVGSITYNSSTGLTVYATTSDYRAKDIIGSVTDSGSVIDSVPVYMGKMHGATQERPMFIAHETPAYAHTGEKDAVDADGNPVYQQMDASALIPVMWAEIQSLRQRVAQLESN